MYPDHLNSYKSMDEYIEDKTLIFKHQTKSDFLVINRENAITKKVSTKAPSKVIFFDKKTLPQAWKLTMLGEHNRENAAAVLQVGKIFKLPLATIKKGITSFPGVEHRLEVVKKYRGITIVNDTTSTTPVAGQKALAAFSQPIVLIAGGSSKNLDLTDFAQEIAKRVRAVVLLNGTATDHLEQEIIRHGGKDKILGRFDRFRPAIKAALAAAKKGDILLESPGCTSFGMFINEFDRGNQFKKIIASLTKTKK
jgi:UDP-N-acetylmuramoylalanine--D-glutamate ligase